MKHVETHSSRTLHTEDGAPSWTKTYTAEQSLEIYSLAELIPSDFVRFGEERRIARWIFIYLFLPADYTVYF